MKSVFFSLVLGSICSCAVAAEKRQMDSVQKNKVVENNIRKPLGLFETFDNDGINLGARGDVLYMVYNSPVLTYASEQHVGSGNVLHSKILDVPGKMSVGCNVALMFTMHRNPGYTFETSWYHIVSTFSDHERADDLLPAHSAALSVARPGHTHIHAHQTLNFFDFMVKKQFALGEWFTVMPGAGLVGGYMDGKSKAHFHSDGASFSVPGTPEGTTAITEADLDYTTKFEGIGLKLGGSSAFKIWKSCTMRQSFRLTAEFFYNVLYGLAKANLDYHHNGTYANLTGVHASYSHHHGVAFFDSLLGLAWDARFRNDTLYLDLHAGWRFQAFTTGWKQFEAVFNDSVHPLDYYGQGLQAGLTFKF